jgi:hypothetical protein
VVIAAQLSFTKLESVSTRKSIHGIYPYRGKISSLDAAKLISQFPRDSVLLDPFCGSGTIVYESAKKLKYAIGVDNNPVAIQIANGKINQFSPNDCLVHLRSIMGKINFQSKMAIPIKAERYFHPDTANEIMLQSLLLDYQSNLLSKGGYRKMNSFHRQTSGFYTHTIFIEKLPSLHLVMGLHLLYQFKTL